MQGEKPWINPGPAQETAWAEQRLQALASTRKSVEMVMALPTQEERGRFMADYREKWGDVCAEALEAMVRNAWEKRRA